jgi:hypothetical protein
LATGSSVSNIQALVKLQEYAKDHLTPEEFNNKLLLAEVIWGRTAWHMATEDKPELLGILMELAKELLTPEDISNKFLFAKDDSEQTALQLASNMHNADL